MSLVPLGGGKVGLPGSSGRWEGGFGEAVTPAVEGDT